MKKCLKKIEPGDWLNFVGVILGIIFSFIIAYCAFNAQETATNNLENRLKFSEIVIELHKEVRLCKEELKGLSREIEKNGFDQYSDVVSSTLFKCRSRLAPFISGLKIFKNNEFGAKEHTYLRNLDLRITGVFQKSNGANSKFWSVSDYQLLNNEVMALSISDKNAAETLDGLEEMLLGPHP